MHKSIKLNYFEHINIFQSCNQPGIDNKSSNFISEMVFLSRNKNSMVFFAKNFRGSKSIHCEVSENKSYVSVT